MMRRPESSAIQDELIHVLAAEKSAIESLDDVLEKEQRALAACDPDSLASLSAEKFELLTRLEKWTRLWDSCASKAGYSPDVEAMQTWIDAHRNPVLSAHWQNLTTAMESIRSKNAINGRLITSQLHHVQRQFSALCDNATRQGLYGADGNHHRDTNSRSITAV